MGPARLIFWDLGGQEDLQTLWDKVLRGCRAGWVGGGGAAPCVEMVQPGKAYTALGVPVHLSGAPLLEGGQVDLWLGMLAHL